MTFDPYTVRSVFLALRRSPNACNWCQGQAMKMAEKVDGFGMISLRQIKPSLNMASTPQQSPRLAMKQTRLEAEMESPTIRKVRACFEEAEKQLFSPIQECLTSLP